MEKEVWKYQVWLGPNLVFESIDKLEALEYFNSLPSGVGKPSSQWRGLTQTKTLIDDGED